MPFLLTDERNVFYPRGSSNNYAIYLALDLQRIATYKAMYSDVGIARFMPYIKGV